ncbi:hypothetical protein BH10PAT3_BH10PAT3_2030 [soil metagenome]
MESEDFGGDVLDWYIAAKPGAIRPRCATQIGAHIIKERENGEDI